MNCNRNIVLNISYDGTNYHGWQKSDEGPSIEETLQYVIERILQTKVILQAASRTDAGVHARGQIVNFIHDGHIPQFPIFLDNLNGLLPYDIAVNQVVEKEISFHPTIDCIGKEYHYTVCIGHVQMPSHRLYSWHFFRKLDLELIREAAKLFEGTHDFKAFCNVKKTHKYRDYIRCVTSISVIEMPENRLKIIIKGNNFLYRMVRNIVGTILYVGCGKLKIDLISQLLKEGERKDAGFCAPAHGLCLEKVFYTNSNVLH